jgi:hypothetical protein
MCADHSFLTALRETEALDRWTFDIGVSRKRLKNNRDWGSGV